jgi:hypothetical protein
MPTVYSLTSIALTHLQRLHLLLSYLAELLLEWETFQTNAVEGIKTHFVINNYFFLNRADYVITWKNIVEPGRPHMTILCMRIACWITKSTNTHSQYVIIIAFPLQQWLQERASIWCYKHIACLVVLLCSVSCINCSHVRVVLVYMGEYLPFVTSQIISRCTVNGIGGGFQHSEELLHKK